MEEGSGIVEVTFASTVWSKNSSGTWMATSVREEGRETADRDII